MIGWEKCLECEGSGQVIGCAHDCCTMPCSNCNSKGQVFMKNQTAMLGVDGNCGFALLGPNIQEGEAEFIEVKAPAGDWEKAEAASEAFDKLKARVAPDDILRFGYGTSHPYHDNTATK